ncbi:MAG: hypothetical protein ACRDTP_10210 [Mycobacteriales bacterium]
MSTGFDAVGQGVTITLGPDADGAFAITLERGHAKVRSQEGPALLDDAAALGRVIDGMYADLMAAEHETT